jgi:hypothetical protein
MVRWEPERKLRLFSIPRRQSVKRFVSALLLLFSPGLVCAQSSATRAPIIFTVVDENDLAVPGAEVTILEPGFAAVSQWTDYAGHCPHLPQQSAPYQLRVDKPGFYQTVASDLDPSLNSVRIVLNHEQIVTEQVNVTDSVPGIDIEQISNKITMNTPEIVNIPYITSRDIRNLLPFYPGIVQDSTGQVHVAGSETWGTLDLLDGLDMRSPLNGVLSMRVSADAVRSIDAETTRYPVQYGRTTGGVIAFFTGMGDNKFRFNATNFVPSFRDLNGIRFDQFVPRFTFSGPLVKDRAWYYDGVELEYDNIYIAELPANADTDELVRGSNLAKFQVNLTSKNILTGALLFNDYHSPYDGISSLTPQQSTTKHDTIAWLPYIRDQWSFGRGALLDVAAGFVRIRDGYEPHGDSPYQITPELPNGSYFENLTGTSQRTEGAAGLYLPPLHWAGRHDFKLGLDLDHIGYDENDSRAPVSYLREDGTLLRQSVFPSTAPFTIHNAELGAYAQDRWLMRPGLLVEPGLRFDWDEIIRRLLVAPRIAATYSPPGATGSTKLSAGIGLYYEHTQLEYLTRALAGIRYDTNYATDGVTPLGPPQETSFVADDSSLQEARAINWSVSAEQKLPYSIFASAGFLQKRLSNEVVYANQSEPAALSGNYLLTNGRQDHYNSVELDARRLFANGYSLFVSYTRSSARTNAAIDFIPTLSLLGPQRAGPLAWDTPNRVISRGWLPLPLPILKHKWDFVYALDWRTGFPFTSINDNWQVVGQPGSERYPNYVCINPGLEWRFHFHGAYFGLRGVIENITNSENPVEVINDVDSPQYGTFSEFLGRALTARIRLIGSK